jgi:hypothetical protein
MGMKENSGIMANNNRRQQEALLREALLIM